MGICTPNGSKPTTSLKQRWMKNVKKLEMSTTSNTSLTAMMNKQIILIILLIREMEIGREIMKAQAQTLMQIITIHIPIPLRLLYMMMDMEVVIVIIIQMVVVIVMPVVTMTMTLTMKVIIMIMEITMKIMEVTMKIMEITMMIMEIMIIIITIMIIMIIQILVLTMTIMKKVTITQLPLGKLGMLLVKLLMVLRIPLVGHSKVVLIWERKLLRKPEMLPRRLLKLLGILRRKPPKVLKRLPKK